MKSARSRTPTTNSAMGLAKTVVPTRSAARRPRPPASSARPRHRRAQSDDERVLAVGLVEAEHEDEQPRRPDVVRPPCPLCAEIVEERDEAGGEGDDDGPRDVLGEPVVEEPVGDGPVAPAVPERVVEDPLALTQQEDLVDVGGVVPAGQPAPVHEDAHDADGGDGEHGHEEAGRAAASAALPDRSGSACCAGVGRARRGGRAPHGRGPAARIASARRRARSGRAGRLGQSVVATQRPATKPSPCASPAPHTS